MTAFVPSMGASYTENRNFDHGPGAHRDVSNLSPYVRRRLVLERDVVAAAIAAHGLEGSAKFVQEVMWRGYFKGWLEQRPVVWTHYRKGLEHDLKTLEQNERLRRAVEVAEAGNTGLACFDAWATELIETGYLHNHARMWFASIWIFTLRLPWRIGADFFYRHLLDGDPASNTLSWRWVAGLHTRGKPYVAQSWNISQFTSQRFTPGVTDFAEDVRSLHDEEPDGLPPVQRLRSPKPPLAGLPTAILITEEDCRVEDFDLATRDVVAIATLSSSHLRSIRPVAEHVMQFEAQALADAASRLGAIHTVDGAPVALCAGRPEDFATWATRCGARQIVTPYVPTGPLRDWLHDAEPALAESNVRFAEWQRDWDRTIWPLATAGFFKIKDRIPSILHTVGVM